MFINVFYVCDEYGELIIIIDILNEKGKVWV